jgi:UDP-2,3-diacylglucosamine pyrophosphatase LpxH
MEKQDREYESALVISDTHIGLPNSQVFHEDFEKFIRFLSSNKSLPMMLGNDRVDVKFPGLIILLGDFVDLWDGDLSKLHDFLAQYARSLTEKVNVFYLRGNYDYVIPNINPATFGGMNPFEICEYKVLRIAGKSCFFIHGHQFMSAFGRFSLAFESFINPYYSIVQWFFSRLASGHGKQVTIILTGFAITLALLLTLGRQLLAPMPGGTDFYLSIVLGVLLVVGFVTLWRLFQKSVWKAVTMIFGEKWNSIRGAVRGDTIEYLTARSRPISRWFEKATLSKEARESGLVCFGHTHIPEGPMKGQDELKDIMFVNTGSWVKPPQQDLRRAAEIARRITRPYDVLDEYVFILSVLVASFLFFTQRVSVYLAITIIIILSALEIVVVLGKSSYRRIERSRVRSLAYIGKEVKADPPVTLLYWDPRDEVLTIVPPEI